MRSYLFFLFSLLIGLSSCKISDSKKANDQLAERNFDHFHYIYHFNKHEFEESHIQVSEFKPKAFDIGGKVFAHLYEGDSLIRFIYKSSKEKGADSTIELFRKARLTQKELAVFPSELFGCKFLGAFNSQNEDIPDNFYCCFYANDQDDLLKVVHLYKPGNVSAAFFYTKDSIDLTRKYENDLPLLLAIDRPLNVRDTVKVIFRDTIKMKF